MTPCCADPRPVLLDYRITCARCGALLTAPYTLARDAWAAYHLQFANCEREERGEHPSKMRGACRFRWRP